MKNEIQILELLENNDYQYLLNFFVKDIESKYVIRENKNKEIFDNAKLYGQNNIAFGEHKDYSAFQEQEIIGYLSNLNQTHPLRVLMLGDRIFADNTYWAIAYLKRFGKDTKLGQIPFYIIDLSKQEPQLINHKGAFNKSEQKLAKFIGNASYFKKLLQKGFRPKNLSYTIGNLEKDLFDKINRELILE